MAKSKPKKLSVDPAENLHKYSAPAMESGFEILELLSTVTGLSLTEISKRMDKTRASVFRMMAVLRKLGYVEYSSQYRLYRLSHKMFKISHQHTSVNKITSVALPIMRSLSETIDESCYLSFFSQGGTLVMARQESDRLNNSLLVRVGSDDSLIDNCAGHIILTFATDQERDEMIEAAKFIRSEVIKKNATFKKMLLKIKKQGYELMPSTTLEGVIDIGFPIFNTLGQLAGALLVSNLKYLDQTDRLSTKELVHHIGNAATKISLALGYDSENLARNKINPDGKNKV